MAAVLGVERAAIHEGLPIQEVSCGLPFVFVPLASRAAVDRCVLDPRANDVTFKEAALVRRGISVFSVEAAADDATVYSRMFGGGRGCGDRDPPADRSAAISYAIAGRNGDVAQGSSSSFSMAARRAS